MIKMGIKLLYLRSVLYAKFVPPVMRRIQERGKHLFNEECRRESEGVITGHIACKLFPDHLETAEDKRQRPQDWPINLLVGPSP
jgi:hypothetical protein